MVQHALPVLLDCVHQGKITLEKVVEKKAIKKFIENQKGDAYKTYADISKAQDLLDYNPSFKFYDGIRKFYNWYLNDK